MNSTIEIGHSMLKEIPLDHESSDNINSLKENINSPLKQLPQDLKFYLLGFFDRYELRKTAQLDKEFYGLSNNDVLRKSAKWPALDYAKPLSKKRKRIDIVQEKNEHFSLGQINEHHSLGNVNELSNGKIIFSIFNKLYHWDFETNQMKFLIKLGDCINSVCVLNTKQFAVISISSIYILDSETLAISDVIPLDSKIFKIESVSLSNGVFVFFNNKTLYTVDTKTKKIQVTDVGISISSICALSDDNIAIAFTRGEPITIFDPHAGTKINLLSQKRGTNLQSIQELRDGRIVVSYNEEIFIWDRKENLTKFAKADSWIEALEVLPNGDIVSTSGKKLQIWDFKTGKSKLDLVYDACIDTIRILRDGRILTTTRNMSGKIPENITIQSFDVMKVSLNNADMNNNNIEDDNRPKLK